MLTFLHHSDPTIPHYRKDEWSFIRGALATVDRPLLGWIGRVLLHNVCFTSCYYSSALNLNGARFRMTMSRITSSHPFHSVRLPYLPAVEKPPCVLIPRSTFQIISHKLPRCSVAFWANTTTMTRRCVKEEQFNAVELTIHPSAEHILGIISQLYRLLLCGRQRSYLVL
jgi:hypothetical protein